MVAPGFIMSPMPLKFKNVSVTCGLRVDTNSFDYAENAFRGSRGRLLQIIVCAVVFPLIYGYFTRIILGGAPDLSGWGRPEFVRMKSIIELNLINSNPTSGH